MEFTSESGNVISLRRLTFGEARKMHELIETIYTADSPSEAIYGEEFDKLIKTVTSKAHYEAIQELDFDEVWRLWEEYCEFARFAPFFMEASAAQEKRQTKLVERQMAGAAERMKMMKGYGLVPDDFSLNTLTDSMEEKTPAMKLLTSGGGESKQSTLDALERLRTQKSTTSSPPSTGGAPKKSTK